MAKICLLGRSGSKPAGTDRYSRNLISELGRLRGNDYYTTFSERFEGVENLRVGAPRNPLLRTAHSSLLLPLELRRRRFDIIHGLTMWLPLFSFGERKAVSVHDITPLLFPDFHERSLALKFRHGVARTIRGADIVIASSRNTKADLIREMGMDEGKIEVVHLAVEHEKFRPVKDEGVLAAARRRYSLEGDFLLSVGTIEPRKNYAGLLRSFKAVLEGKPSLRLVIAGKRGWKYEGVIETAEKDPSLKRSVTFLDYVDDRDLPALYSLASAFVYPSLYEGFGLPPLEAMACGCPVIASDNSSIPEVVGDAGILVDPHDQGALSDGIIRLLEDPSLSRELSKKGLARARGFTWEKTAKATEKAYGRLME